MYGVGEITGHNPEFMSPAHVANMAGHAAVGCASSVAQGGRCGPGALSGAAGSFASALSRGQSFGFRLAANSAVGGVASVAAGGNFANGAVTSAYGYLFNDMARCARPGMSGGPGCGLLEGGGGGGSPEWGRQLGRAIAGAFASIVGGDTRPDDPYRMIYRAIGPRELEHLAAAGNYGFSPNASGKYFAMTPSGVYAFADSPFNAGRDMTITSTSIPQGVLNSGYQFNDPGGAGASVHFSDAQLPHVYSRMTPVQILPRRLGQ